MRNLVKMILVNNLLVSETQVTQGLFEEVMGWNPTRKVSRFSPPTPHRCVRDVSWFQCVRFCNKLSDLEGLQRAYLLDETAEVAFTIEGANGYRLPTAAEAKVFANKLLVAVANRNSEFLLDVHNHRLNDLGLKGVGSSWEWTIQDADRKLDKIATCDSEARGWFMGGSVAVTFRVVRSR
jgi:formylglycine-generating enzyme required for sulfatase activity